MDAQIIFLPSFIIEQSSTLTNAKIDTLWARYNKNDQSDCFHFLNLSFFHRLKEMRRVNNFWNLGAYT